MWFLDKDISINSDDSQALRDVIGAPIVNDSILDGSSLPRAYVEEKIIPELAKISDQKKIENLKVRVKWNEELLSLIEDYTVMQFSTGTLPWVVSWAEQVRVSTKSTFKSVVDFMTDLSGIEDDESKEIRMRNEIILRRRSIMAKFDQYVRQGDGEQKWDDTSFWGFSDADDLKKGVKSHTKVQESVHDVKRDDMIAVLNEVAKISMDDNLKGINFFGKTLDFESKLDKLVFFASYLSAVEDWCDKLIPWIISQGVDSGAWIIWDATKWTVDKGLGIAWDVAVGTLKIAWDHPIWTLILVPAAVSTIRWKSMAGKFLRNKVARNIPKVGKYIPEAGVVASAPVPSAGINSPVTPEANIIIPEAPKTHVELARSKAVLDSMHKQYLPWATAPVMTLKDFKIEALDPGTATNIEYQSRLEKVTMLHDELMSTKDPALKQDLRRDIEKVLSGESDKGFFWKMKDRGFDMVENTKRNLSGRGKLSKWDFPSLSRADGTDIMRTMSQEISADQKKLQTFRDLLGNANSKVEDIKTEYEALGSIEKEILKTDKDLRIAELELKEKTDITDRITRAKTVDEVKVIQEEAKNLKFTDVENAALKTQAKDRITVIENFAKDEIRSEVERAKKIEVVESIMTKARAPALNFTPDELTALQERASARINLLTQQEISKAKTAIEAATEKAEVQKIFTEANALTEITDVQRMELLTKNREKIAEIDALEKAATEAATKKEIKLEEIKAEATKASAKATATGKAGGWVNLTVNTGAPVDSGISTTKKSPTKPSAKPSAKIDITNVKNLSGVWDVKVQAIQDLMEVAGWKGKNTAKVLETMYVKLGIDPTYSCSTEIAKLENIFGSTTMTGISADDWKIIAKDEVLYTRVIKDVVARPRLSSIEYKTKSIEVSERIKIEPGKSAEWVIVKFFKSIIKKPIL